MKKSKSALAEGDKLTQRQYFMKTDLLISRVISCFQLRLKIGADADARGEDMRNEAFFFSSFPAGGLFVLVSSGPGSDLLSVVRTEAVPLTLRLGGNVRGCFF